MGIKILGAGPRTGGVIPAEVIDAFLATDARFFGELGLPNDQAGWVDVAPAPATITIVTEDVFGETRDVVKHFDDGASSTGSQFALSVQDWININTFGAAYGGVARLDSTDGSAGFFTGLQANAAENPLATGNRRYGLTFRADGAFLEVDDIAGGAITMDGTLGNPIILFDEYFTWEVVVPPGLGAAKFIIKDVETSLTPTFAVNAGGLGSHAAVSSGSSSGTNRVVFHSDFGVTVYEDSPTKTFSAAAMAAKVAQIVIPTGRRDYTIIVPDGNPRSVGDILRLTRKNVGGTVTLKAENTAAPQAVFFGLNEVTEEVLSAGDVTLVNSVENSNVYDFGIPPAMQGSIIPIFVGLEDTTVANTTVATSLLGAGKGSLVARANRLAIGDCFNFRAGGIFSATANPTLRLKLMFGTLFVGDTLAVVISNVTNGHWVLEGTATVRSIGATGTLSVEGSFLTSAGDHFKFAFLVPTIVDMTKNNNLDITAQWGTAAAGNTITRQNASLIQILAPGS